VTDGAVKVNLPYVKAAKDRQGQVKYWYFRRNGRYWKLPGEPLSPQWQAAYARAKAASEPQAAASVRSIRPIEGSLKALATEYYASPEFRERSENTKRIYRIVIDRLVDKHGDKPVALIERRHVKRWRDERAETPGMANMVVKVANMLLMFAVENDYRRDNPAMKITLFKLGEHRAWTPDELAAFEQRWPTGTMQRRAYALARYTGQRCGDVAAMTRGCRVGGAINVTQQKTGKALVIREHRELTAELARGEQGHLSLLVREDGSGFDGESLSPWFADAIEAAGLPDDCVMHGLRKVAASDLADAGCTEHEIAAVTGQSLAEVARYTKAANQSRLSKAAILKLEQNENRIGAGKRPKGRIGKQWK
jgi:hypothetical protein